MNFEMAKVDLSQDVKQALIAMAYVSEHQDIALLQTALRLRKTFKSKGRLKNKDQSHRLKIIYRKLLVFRGLIVFTYMSLAFFEVPSWCRIDFYSYDCTTHGHTVPWSNIPKLNNTGTRAIELFCIVFLLALNTFRSTFTQQTRTRWLRDVFLWSCSLAASADILYSFITASSLMYAQFIRPVIFLMVIRSVRESMMSILRTIKATAGIILLVALHIIIFAWAGLVLFFGTAEGTAYFKDIRTSLWNMLIALTTTNFPDLMLPAYYSSRFYALFFVAFYLIGLFFLYKLVLASFYSNYRQQIENLAKKFVDVQNKFLLDAFKLLDNDNLGYIPKEKFNELIIILKGDLHFDGNTEKAIGDYLAEKETIYAHEFEDIIKFMHDHQSQVNSGAHLLKRMFPAFYGPNNLRRVLVNILNSSWFTGVFHVVTLTIIIAQVFDAFLSYYYEDFWVYLQIFYICFYWFEMLAHLATVGLEAFFTSFRGLFDFVVNSANLVAFIVIVLSSNYQSRGILQILGATRLLYLLKILRKIKEINFLFRTLAELVPSFSNLLGIVVVTFYIFGMLGVALFGGLVYADNESIFSSTLIPPNYVYVNFNDFPNGCVVLFELMIVNNWWVITEVFTLATNNYYRWFFIAFFVVAPFIVMNILISFVIEMFNSQRKRQLEQTNQRFQINEIHKQHKKSEAKRLIKAETSFLEETRPLARSQTVMIKPVKSKYESIKVSPTYRDKLSSKELASAWRLSDL